MNQEKENQDESFNTDYSCNIKFAANNRLDEGFESHEGKV